MKTNELRKMLKERLSHCCETVYFKLAADNALYPHIVFSFPVTNKLDAARDDTTVDIEIWAKSEFDACEILDSVEESFNVKNLPQIDYLPTIYVEIIKDVEDPDKSIVHKHVELSVQNYER